MANRNNRCRVSIAAKNGPCFGRGFVADPKHVITCKHVAEFFLKATQTQLVHGSLITVKTEEGAFLTLSVVKLGESNQDICVLKRTDGQEFPPHECALWARGRPGDRYVGLGMSAEFDSIGLKGKITDDDTGGTLQIVSAEDTDNRIVAGCSGAPLFGPFDGPMLGMVTEYQQDKSGKIYSAEALARFWHGLKRADVAPSEGFPSFTAEPPQDVPFDKMVREVDRAQQKNGLRQVIEAKQLLTGSGFFAAQFIALPDDLPWECVNAMCDNTFSRIMARLGPDSNKSVTPSSIALYEVIGESPNPQSLLLMVLSDLLRAESASIEDLRHALKATLRPLAIILTANPAELVGLTPELARAWAEALKQLALPNESQPVALFISVEIDKESSIAEIAAQITNLGDEWHVNLPPLAPIRRMDVTNWANNSLKDDASGRRARDKIEQVIAANSAGRETFRLRELKQWFSR